jgi:hypothetical protein
MKKTSLLLELLAEPIPTTPVILDFTYLNYPPYNNKKEDPLERITLRIPIKNYGKRKLDHNDHEFTYPNSKRLETIYENSYFNPSIQQSKMKLPNKPSQPINHFSSQYNNYHVYSQPQIQSHFQQSQTHVTYNPCYNNNLTSFSQPIYSSQNANLNNQYYLTSNPSYNTNDIIDPAIIIDPAQDQAKSVDQSQSVLQQEENNSHMTYWCSSNKENHFTSYTTIPVANTIQAQQITVNQTSADQRVKIQENYISNVSVLTTASNSLNAPCSQNTFDQNEIFYPNFIFDFTKTFDMGSYDPSAEFDNCPTQFKHLADEHCLLE